MSSLASILVALLSLTPGPAAAQQREIITYLHPDITGSPIMATDAAGNVLWKERYAPYGERQVNADDGRNSLWFTGKGQDSQTGLSYFGARWYDPLTGRFTGVDPVSFVESNPHSFNRYAYANNNPYKFKDPDGRLPQIVVGALVWAIRLVHSSRALAATDMAVQAAMPSAGAVATVASGGKALGKTADVVSDAARGIAGFTAREAAAMREARGILASPQMATLRAAHDAGVSAGVSINGRTVLYEPGLSASGMTLFGENGFVIGRDAFASTGELGRTVLHELYRLSHSAAAGGVSGALASKETADAARFAERAVGILGP
jgi:RHS repeat-associated protein